MDRRAKATLRLGIVAVFHVQIAHLVLRLGQIGIQLDGSL